MLRMAWTRIGPGVNASVCAPNGCLLRTPSPMCASESIVLCSGYNLMKGAMYHLVPRSSIALSAISGIPAATGGVPDFESTSFAVATPTPNRVMGRPILIGLEKPGFGGAGRNGPPLPSRVWGVLTLKCARS